MVVSHPDGKPRDVAIREDIKELETGFSWSELMRLRGYSEEWIAEATLRRDKKLYGDLD
jgi:hypothetical protein